MAAANGTTRGAKREIEATGTTSTAGTTRELARTKAGVTDGPSRVYVLDTSVLLADPNALRRFHEHDVVLPVVVITELEAKRHHPELGYFARAALRMLDELQSHPRQARRAVAGH